MHKKATQCVHSGNIDDEKYGGAVSPVYISTAFPFTDVDYNAYPRYFNTPNQSAVARKLADLENAEDALVFSSGMAAITTVLMALLKSGDHALVQSDIYGGTYHAVSRELERYGISFDFVYSSDPSGFSKAMKSNTRLIYIETPSNPLLKLIDIEAVASIAREAGVVSVIDNTFASPINQNPLDLGIDIVTHSATKYLAGHSDLCCGAVMASREYIGQVKASAVNYGGSLNARDCALLERSLKTLAIRVDRQNSNAQAIAEFLETQDMVKQVHYPGLPSHSQHDLARRQMKSFGGMLSFSLKGDSMKFLKKLKLISPLMSLGGVESTISMPVLTSHAKLSEEAREAAGIDSSLLRLSVGIEDKGDLIQDLLQAL